MCTNVLVMSILLYAFDHVNIMFCFQKSGSSLILVLRHLNNLSKLCPSLAAEVTQLAQKLVAEMLRTQDIPAGIYSETWIL